METIHEHAGASELLGTIEAIRQEFHLGGDVYVLQRRCEALSQAFDEHAPSKELLGWIASQAELIDCGLIRAPVQSLDDMLDTLIRSIRNRA